MMLAIKQQLNLCHKVLAQSSFVGDCSVDQVVVSIIS